MFVWFKLVLVNGVQKNGIFYAIMHLKEMLKEKDVKGY